MWPFLLSILLSSVAAEPEKPKPCSLKELEGRLQSERKVLQQKLRQLKSQNKWMGRCAANGREKPQILTILESLSPIQQQYCEFFLEKHLPQYLKILSAPQLRWSVTEKWLSLKYADGSSHPVAAFTSPESFSEIFFHCRSLENVAAENLSLEWMHQVGQKISLPEGPPLVDLQSVGPFKESNGGMKLLLSVGAAVSRELTDAHSPLSP